MEADNGIKSGYELPVKDAGRDVLGDVLKDPTKQGRITNISRLPINQPNYKPPQKWSDYSELPGVRGHRY